MEKTVRIVTWQKTHAQSIQNFAWLPIAPGKKSAETAQAARRGITAPRSA
jgi:hypothetical protein